MADNKMNKQNEKMSNPQTTKNEPTGSQQQDSGLGGDFRSEQGQFSGQDRDKSAIGGGQTGQKRGETGGQSGQQTGQFDKEFDKNKERERTDR